ncbi:hypothetical protein [Endozoicomonas montiporae]|uniref:CDP-6-deoxy-delta-3,4-glucoseen reductase n=1 Tax=Endozoicomonas montiporae CL-33 TaxID=570277 RepID=A0A142B6L3_9GAMM|nr:hypothetical protein [Endozoicomonas montiporae]AMO54389.1 CDP-6-deoxy-delta-3,4-glucoseen reductase [Endozoicomonas montiporae CL-33]
MGNIVSEQAFNVIDMHPAGSDVYRIKLKPRSGFVPPYRAGQYLEILLPGRQPCAFSIASAPSFQQEDIELHVQQLPESQTSTELFDQLNKGRVDVRLPSGNCFLPDPLPETPLVFVAAGTGFAQMKSMVEHCLNQNHAKGIHLYWGARTPAGFYLPYLPIQWSARGVHYHPVVSDAIADDDWCGRHGLLYEAILADKEQLLDGNIYLSGSPQMVYATIDVIENAGFNRKNMHSDVFDYAPRP